MKIICIGRNYAEHAKELNNEISDEIIFFMKPETALLRPFQPFFYPDFSNAIHFEAELVLRICNVGKNIQQKFAHRYYDAVTVGIDFTARDLQQKCKDKGLPWEIAKSFDNSAVIGSWKSKETMKTTDINFYLKQNGILQQSGNNRDMINSFDVIISYVSKFITLKRGDLIFTGTPKGVGSINKKDILELGIENEQLLTCKIL